MKKSPKNKKGKGSKHKEGKKSNEDDMMKAKVVIEESEDLKEEFKGDQLEEQKDLNGIRKDFKVEDEKTACLPLPMSFSESWNILKEKLMNIATNKANQEISDIISLIKWCIDKNKIEDDKIKLGGLESILSSFEPTEINSFLTDTIPFIASSALQIETLFDSKNSLDLLMSQNATEIELSRSQIVCLLAHCFLCSLPLAKALKGSRFKCFYSLYTGGMHNLYKNKLLFLINYFDSMKMMKVVKEDRVKYKRLVIPMKEYERLNTKYWLSSKNPMQPITIKEKGGIEAVKNGILVDFANKYLGGAVLRKGAVQEEILFLTMPELLVTQFMCEKLADNEAMLIQGLGLYGKYSGYSDNLRFKGRNEGSEKYSMIAIDALHFTNEYAILMQFQPRPLLRELNKAFVGFNINKYEQDTSKKIVTGKWGCGAFKGHAQLKMMIQWLAASESGRKLVFCSFEDKVLSKAINVVNKYSKKTVGEVFERLIKFQSHLYDNLLKSKNIKKACDLKSFNTLLFDFLLN